MRLFWILDEQTVNCQSCGKFLWHPGTGFILYFFVKKRTNYKSYHYNVTFLTLASVSILINFFFFFGWRISHEEGLQKMVLTPINRVFVTLVCFIWNVSANCQTVLLKGEKFYGIFHQYLLQRFYLGLETNCIGGRTIENAFLSGFGSIFFFPFHINLWDLQVEKSRQRTLLRTKQQVKKKNSSFFFFFFFVVYFNNFIRFDSLFLVKESLSYWPIASFIFDSNGILKISQISW